MPDNVVIYEWFANFVTEKPQKRKKYVSKIVNKEPYVFYKDFYLTLRTKLISLIKNNQSLVDLKDILKKLNPKKYIHYELLIDQIQDFMQGINYTWVEPPKNTIEYSGLLLKVNPEIGLKINGKILFIKMYFKQAPIDKAKVKVMQKIMQDSLMNEFPYAEVAILDIRRGFLHQIKVNEDIKIPYNLEQEALIWQKYAEEE